MKRARFRDEQIIFAPRQAESGTPPIAKFRRIQFLRRIPVEGAQIFLSSIRPLHQIRENPSRISSSQNF